MKIFVNQVSSEGLFLEEDVPVAELDLETELIKPGPYIKLKARTWRITNALTIDLNIKTRLRASCSRCLDDFVWELDKDVRLNYPLDSSSTFIDLNPEIREEVILDYPIKPLCDLKCKGLCKKCGNNLNQHPALIRNCAGMPWWQGGCNCGST